MEKPSPRPRKTLTADAARAIAVCAGLNARLAARRITAFLEARMEGAGLSLAQFGLLAHIAAAADDTIAGLAERTGLDQSTLSRNLRALERARLVEIAAVERDLRRRAVLLTEAGARRLEAAMPLWRAAHGELAQRIDPAAAQRLARKTQGLVDRI
jgi:DNA-binding MarR family transcriptional regulator